MQPEQETICVLGYAMSFTAGRMPAATFYGDQPYDRIATNAKRKRGTLLARSGDGFPDLLRQMADLWEQEGFATLGDLAAFMQAEQS